MDRIANKPDIFEERPSDANPNLYMDRHESTYKVEDGNE